MHEPAGFDAMLLASNASDPSIVHDIPRSEIPILSLASWGPDFSRQGQFDSPASLTVRGKLFNAGGSADVNKPTGLPGNHLRLRGMLIDTVAVILQSLPSFFLNPVPHDFRPKWLEDDKHAEDKVLLTDLRFALWLQNRRNLLTDTNG